MDTKEEIAKFNEELKNVRNIEQLLNLLNRAVNKSDHGPYYLYGKRRGYRAFDFTKYPYNSNKVHYLYDDSVSTGLSRFENLYKVLSFGE